MKCLKMLTFIPLEEIEQMEHWEDSRINEKKEILAFELTSLVHGEQEAQKAKDSAKALFGGCGDSENMPTTQLEAADFNEGKINITAIVVKCKFAASKGEAKRLIQQGGISVNDNVVSALDTAYSIEEVKEGLKIRKGKKHFHKITF